MYDRSQLIDRTPEDLRTLAKEEFGLDLPFNSPMERTISKILEAQATGLGSDDPSVPEVEKQKEPPAPERKFRIIIHNQDSEEGSTFVKVMVNGVMFQINREKEVVVPERVKEVLDNAIQTRFEPDEEGNLRARDVRRFAYTVLGEVQ